MQNFAVIRSAILEKMTLEDSNFGNFPDVSEVKLSLPPWFTGTQMCCCMCVRLTVLLFQYFFLVELTLLVFHITLQRYFSHICDGTDVQAD